MLFSQLRKKQVVNIVTGCCLGTVNDLVIDESTSSVRAIVVPGVSGNLLSRIKKGTDIVIPWQCIEKIGDDVILARVDAYASLDEKENRQSRTQRI